MQKIIRILSTSKLTGWFFDLGFKFFNRFKFEKELIKIEKLNFEREIINKKFQDIFCDKIVKNGPFKGLAYPEFFSHGSSLYAKLLGSYENELHEIIEKLLKIEFDFLIDVGCAEGYYANGFAMLKPTMNVMAYDIQEKARISCKNMAELNKLNNVKIKEFFSTNEIEQIDLTKKYLFIIDCEGYEFELFNKKNVKFLRNSYLLIELHDLKNEKISPYLKRIFKESHNQTYIYSINPLEKIYKFQLPTDLNEDELLFAFSERSGIMQWVFLEPKDLKF